MKKLLVSIILLVGIVGSAWAVRLNFTPTITMTPLTSTTMRIQLAGLRATGIDSIIVYSAGSDSVTTIRYYFKATVTKDTTVATLAPNKLYMWKVKADSAGTYRTSVPDTSKTYPAQHESLIAENIKNVFQTMFKASAWPPTQVYSPTFSLADANAIDSTMVYEVFPYDGITVVAKGDSISHTFYCMGGYSANALESLWKYAIVDSFSITAAGTKHYTWSIPAACRYFYVRLYSKAGNGHATTDTLSVNRWR